MSNPTHHEPKERRVAVRRASSQEATCHFATLQAITSRWARVLDISDQGIRLVLSWAVQPGQELIVEIPCKDPTRAEARTARVVRVDRQDDGSWTVGCAFVQPLSQEELQAFLE